MCGKLSRHTFTVEIEALLRYYLRKHALRTTAYVAASCACVHLAKQGLKRSTHDVKYLGPAVAFLSDVALPTPIVGPLLMARFML